MNSSPLGKFAAPAAAIASLAIIGVYLVALVTQHVLMVSDASLGDLKAIAFLAAGALFGSAVAVNGYKGPVTAATDQVAFLTGAVAQLQTATTALHRRADDANLPPAAGDVVDPASIVVPNVIVPGIPPPLFRAVDAADAARPPADQVPPS